MEDISIFMHFFSQSCVVNISLFQGRNRLVDDFTDNYIERWFTPGNLKTNDLRPKIVSRVISYEIDNLNRYAKGPLEN